MATPYASLAIWALCPVVVGQTAETPLTVKTALICGLATSMVVVACDCTRYATPFCSTVHWAREATSALAAAGMTKGRIRPLTAVGLALSPGASVCPGAQLTTVPPSSSKRVCSVTFWALKLEIV